MAYTEFKKRSEAINAITDQYPHGIDFYTKSTNGKRHYDMPSDRLKKLWLLGEENFGVQGFLTNGVTTFIDFESRWMLTHEKASFKKQSDAVMMFFLIDRLKMDQMAAT